MMYRLVDDFVFDYFPAIQKIANVIEYFTYASSVTQARILVICASAFQASQVTLLAAQEGWSSHLTSLFLIGVLALLFLVQAQLLENMSNSSGKFRNMLRAGFMYVVFRLLLILICIFKTWYIVFVVEDYEWWRLITSPLMIVAFYLLACDRLPPGDRFFDRFRKRAVV